ncbi:MAG: endolytic transglycosylase MltG [Candidatus Baltobacteraceae bacterium]
MKYARYALYALGSLAVLALLACAALWYAIYADRSRPPEQREVIVERGSTFDEIATRLAEEGVVSNVLTFRALARLRGEDVAVRAGAYRFGPHVTQDEVLRALVSGGAQVAAWVTIPEGFTAAQIAARMESAGVGHGPDLLREFMHESLAVGGARTKNLEGFLFPSTYLVPLDGEPRQIANQLTGEFLRELPRDAAARARALHVTLPQAVTVASLVEREAKTEADRPQIAAVIYNRLRLRMPLQIDAAIEYALPAHKSELSFADLKVDSPYNTYLHAGLPPTPIANPGRPSLEAALRPSKSEYLYYVYCGGGRHVFAKTLAEHQANVARCLQ